MAEAIIKSPEELKEKITLYVQACKDNKRKPTQAGLILVLGYGHPSCIRDLQRRGDEYKLELGRFKLYLEDDRHNRLLTPGQPTIGLIFDLKNNHDWKDRQELTGADGTGLVVNYVSNVKREEDEKPKE